MTFLLYIAKLDQGLLEPNILIFTFSQKFPQQSFLHFREKLTNVDFSLRHQSKICPQKVKKVTILVKMSLRGILIFAKKLVFP
jgi:hypothetical protein